MAESLDWSKLPTSLSWLAELAEQYGHLQFDDPIYDYLRRVGPDERVALRELGERWGKAWEDINRWLDAYPMTTHPEARLVYFTGVLLGTGADAGLL